jgi:transposase InsO family protein
MRCSTSPNYPVWWLRLGIAIERIKPGHPQQNGRHERMHLTLKKEATRPAGINSLLGAEREDNGRSMITC